MTPTCSKCKQVISEADVNVANDVAFCRRCNLAHKLSTLIHGLQVDSDVDLVRPPAGAWCNSTGLGAVIGATHRSVGAAIGTFLFALFWNGIVSVFVLLALISTLSHLGLPAPDWFPVPKMNGNPMTVGITIFIWIFLTPFILIGLAMIGAFLSSIAGRTEVRIRQGEGVVFSGVGALGRNRRFDPQAVRDVRLEAKNWRDSDGDRRKKTEIIIELQDGKLIKFGSMLQEERMKFVAAAVRKILLR